LRDLTFPRLQEVSLAVVAVCLLAGIESVSSASAHAALHVQSQMRPVCAVTFPNGSTPPGTATAALPPVPPVFHGNGKLWVKLWPLGVIVATASVIQPDGSIAIKLPWWRNLNGALTITAVRLDTHAPAVKADVPAGYGNYGFQPSDVVFPTQGCWKVTGRVGKTSLGFVVLVVKAKANGY
jgi:hypothetical protein